MALNVELSYNMGTNPSSILNSYGSRTNEIDHVLVSHLVVPTAFGGPEVRLISDGIEFSDDIKLRSGGHHTNRVLNFKGEFGTLALKYSNDFGEELIINFNGKRSISCVGMSYRL